MERLLMGGTSASEGTGTAGLLRSTPIDVAVLVAHLPDIVFRLDRDLRHRFIGGAVHRISGLHPERFIGKTGRDLGFPADLCDTFEAACRAVLTSGEPREFEMLVRGVWVFHRLIPERGVRGEIESILGVAEDTTSRRNAEEALRTRAVRLETERDSLDRLVQARSEEALRAREQLQVSERMSSIGTLAAGLGHDMNNMLLPLRAHLSAASAAAGTAASENIRQAETIVEYLQELADGLHYLAADGGSDAASGATELHQWWERVGSLLSKALPRHVRLEASIPESLPLVSVSPHRLTQAVLNLIVNAGRAIPPPKPQRGRVDRAADDDRSRRGRSRRGIVRITAEAARTRGRSAGDPDAVVRLTVRDDGVGMSEEIRRRAFDLFFTTKPRGMGTGLGLPLVARVINDSGGWVEIDSAPGKGTSVTLNLPESPSHAPDADGTRGRPALSAAVSIADRRTSSLVRQLLQGSGVATAHGGDPTTADIWIVEPASVRPTEAARWRRGRRRSRTEGIVVVLGPLSEREARDWSGIGQVIVDRRDDYFGIRDGIAHAVDRCHSNERSST